MGVGRLVLVATPIGNLGDLSARAIEELSKADIWIVEDTRVSGKLQSHLGLSKPMRVFNEHTQASALERYVGDLSGGVTAALLTDGGSPAISDPGAILTDLCHEAGIAVDAIPGPSAVTTALMLSGFFAQRYCFLGFLGRKPGPIRQELQPFADSPYTLVLFESPFRIKTLLENAYTALGDRRYAVTRELTKIHQQVYRSRLPHIPSETEVPPKGEVSVVIEGKRKTKTAE
jgi:16S rRNA (cytidine1402-2'-O)-methyltransferase